MQRLLTSPSPRILRDFTLFAAFFTLALFAYLQYLDRLLTPHSIVAFEFAFTPARAVAILGDWGPAGQPVARQSLLADFRFMPAYALTFAGLMLMAARAAAGELQSLGLDLTLAPPAAAVFDLIENLALLAALRAPEAPPAFATLLAGIAAAIKFLLLLICLGYLVWMGAARFRQRRASAPEPPASPPG